MELFFPYTFVTAPGLLPAQFSYTGTMIRTVDSNYNNIPHSGERRKNDWNLCTALPGKRQLLHLKNLPVIQNPDY